jgi:rRNA processing protein Krr1/Pno1
MQAIVAERETQIVETINVPTDKHRSLIGRQGETRKELERKFNVSIEIPRQGDGKTGVTISGQPKDVARAKDHIQGLVKGEEGETVQVPKNLHHAISDNGQFFRKLKKDHQVTVDHAGHKLPPKPAVPPNTRPNGGALPLITDDQDESADAYSWHVVSLLDLDLDGEIPWILRGPPDNVAKARESLTAAIDQASKMTNTGYLVLPDPRTYKYVIGQGGSKVNSIRKQTGCKINVPRDQAKDEAIEICGSADGVEKARELILQAVKEGMSNGSNGSRA